MKKLLLFPLLLLQTLCFAAVHETTWSPDTCACQVVYETDDAAPDKPPVVKQIIKGEEAFKGDDSSTMFAKILEENQRKNKVLNEAMKKDPGMKPEDFKYYYDSNRKLIVTAGVKKLDEAAMETAVGGDKVDVE